MGHLYHYLQGLRKHFGSGNGKKVKRWSMRWHIIFLVGHSSCSHELTVVATTYTGSAGQNSIKDCGAALMRSYWKLMVLSDGKIIFSQVVATADCPFLMDGLRSMHACMHKTQKYIKYKETTYLEGESRGAGGESGYN